MAKYKVLYVDPMLDDVSLEYSLLKKVDAELVVASATDDDTLICEGKDCDAILSVYADINKNVIDEWGNYGKVKVISRQGTGCNNIDINAATANQIMVTNVPDYCADEVATHTITLALALQRELKSFNKRVCDGEWNENPVNPIHRLDQLKFGLFGVGNIGKKVAALARIFQFQVIGYDPFLSEEDFLNAGIVKIDKLEDLAKEADVFSIHTPLTDKTKHIIDIATFQRMKKNCIVVNTSRGGVINQKDLEYAIENGLIAGAGLDVLEKEPPPADSILFSKNNVIITPHIAFYSEESNLELRTRFVENVIPVITKGTPINCINYF